MRNLVFLKLLKKTSSTDPTITECYLRRKWYLRRKIRNFGLSPHSTGGDTPIAIWLTLFRSWRPRWKMPTIWIRSIILSPRLMVGERRHHKLAVGWPYKYNHSSRGE